MERKRAINHVHNLLSGRGVDAVVTGPNDPSISLGVLGEFDSEPIIRAVQKVVDACENRGVASGIHLRDIKTLMFWK